METNTNTNPEPVLNDLAPDPELEKELQNPFRNNFIFKKIKQLMNDRIDTLENTPVNVAITGDSGTGKSTLVNTLRGLPPTDPNAAQIGSIETTMEATPYKHPSFPNVVFWDLPGVGTPKNPKATYKKKMKLKYYDFFIITISNRFTENTLWLASELEKMHKPYFFARSKLDIEIAMRRKHNPNITDQEVIDQLRNDILAQTTGLRKASVFIISGELDNSDRWDFPKLKQSILDVLPEVKRNTLVVSLGGYATELIEYKYQVLKGRIRLYAIASALGAVVPIPGFSFGVDTALIVKMAQEFAKAFGLTLGQVQRSYFKVASRARVLSILGKASALWTTKAVLKIIAAQASSGIAEEIVSIIPVMGQGAAACISFVATYQCGKIILKKMRHFAEEIAQEIIDYQMEVEGLKTPEEEHTQFENENLFEGGSKEEIGSEVPYP